MYRLLIFLGNFQRKLSNVDKLFITQLIELVRNFSALKEVIMVLFKYSFCKTYLCWSNCFF